MNHKRYKFRGEYFVGILLVAVGVMALATFGLALIGPRLNMPDLDAADQKLPAAQTDLGKQLDSDGVQQSYKPTPILPTPLALDAANRSSASALNSEGSELSQLLPASPLAADPSDSLNRLGLTADDGSSQPFRIVIPDLYIDAPVRPVNLEVIETEDETYQQWLVPNMYAAGWQETSAPLGTIGNTVINGHNNVYGAIFKDLVDLELGAEIVLYDADQAYTYEVTERELLEEAGQPLKVRLDNARWMLPTSDERITLISCWPAATNSHRIVVVAHPTKSNDS